jgi:hypothetical protein
MPEYSEIPLHLCQVLEEEFENLPRTADDLDGAAFDGSPLAFDSPPRAVASPPHASADGVTVADDWMFRQGHVNASTLATTLQYARQAWLDTHPGEAAPGQIELKAERDLYTFLAFRYPGLSAQTGSPADAVALLNLILRDADEAGVENDAEWTVFKVERFEKLALRPETRGLLELAGAAGDDDIFGGTNTFEGAEWARANSESFDRSDLARFWRLLLEDAFPAPAVKRVYDLRLSRVAARAHAGARSALCLSGGGIRSGTFALGVIQSLARRGLLKQFDYLSTVSGGGYIGGWLTAWIHRHPHGLDGVVADLGGATRDPKLEPEPEPLRHLREYSSFITPKTGVLSADTWTFVIIYLRNLLLNWVVLIPLLASVLMIPRVATAVVLAKPDWLLLKQLLLLTGFGVYLLKPDWRTVRSLIVLGALSWLTIYAGERGWLPSSPDASREALVEGVLLVAGTLVGAYVVAYMRLNRPSNTGAVGPGSSWDKRRDQSSFLWLCLLPLTVSTTLLTTFWAWFRQTAGVSAEKTVVSVNFLGWTMGEFTGFLVYGALLGFTGWLLYVGLSAYSWVRRPDEVRRMAKQGWRNLLRGIIWNAGREFLVTILVSVIGAILLYVAAVKIPIFYDPVVNPFDIVYFKDGPAPRLLPYSQWFYAELYTWLALPVYFFVFFLGVTLFVGFTSRRSEKSPRERRRRKAVAGNLGKLWRWLTHPFDHAYVEDEDREWMARASAWVFIVMGGWLFFGGLVVFGPLLYFALGNWLTGLGGVAGLLSLLGGRSARTPGNKKQEAQQSWWQSLGVNLLVVAAFVFFACIVIAVSLLTGTLIVWLAGTYFKEELNSLLGISPRDFALFKRFYPFQSAENVFRGTHFPSWLYLLALALALQLFGRLFARIINLNKFSLHAGYRDRIVRAFLGASRLKGERSANPFTGFDPRDDLFMEELRPLLLRESDFKEPGGLKHFVAELNRPPELRSPIAAFLRRQIERTEGDSRRYFKEPPGSIDINPSFRAALFGDLNHILQVEVVPPAEDVLSPTAVSSPPSENEDAAGVARIKENRRRLNAAFDDIKFPPPPSRLMHVVNMTLNLVGGERLAWQQRRAASFTATPLHSGSLFVGYRRTHDYGGKNGIKLGTAVAASGAAASSNMGYFSPSVFVTFVLTFFNARLGWWLGNPGVHGADTFYRSHPQNALSPILDEAFGLTNDRNPYVLLSDGGHFENLGLYEMVLRRCRNIIVVDGSADPSGAYDDLGGAVRKIRIDFGIPIDFPSPFPIISRPESEQPDGKQSGQYFVVGDIHYEYVDDPELAREGFPAAAPGKQRHPLTGRLIYIKPAIYDREPRDIFNYAKGDPSFPHESTADQFFDEPQFESHRMLGFYILEKLIGDAGVTSPPGTLTIEQLVDLLDNKK